MADIAAAAAIAGVSAAVSTPSEVHRRAMLCPRYRRADMAAAASMAVAVAEAVMVAAITDFRSIAIRRNAISA
jgi:hypothetical protein